MSFIDKNGKEHSLLDRTDDLYTLDNFIDHVSLRKSTESFLDYLDSQERQIDMISVKEDQMDPANVNNYPEATATDIQKEFERQIESLGKTTTLDVKAALRAKGLWVNQAEVSDTVHTVALLDSSKYHARIQNGHIEYEKIQHISSAAGSGIPKGSYQSLSGGSAIKYPTSIKVKIKKPAPIGNWNVCARSGLGSLLPAESYKGMTRNKARYEYAKQYKVKYLDVLARKF